MGFTIFILGLILVATMIPGLMIGWQRSISIDYDAVAYRTGVILAEDSGWSPDGTARWETYDAVHLAEVTRIGLSVWAPVGGDTQNVLAPIKVAKFFNSPRYGSAKLLDLDYPDDYRSKVIFGDYPYQFNISLRTFDDVWNQQIGSPLPDDYGYGYIRRVVKVKEISGATIDGTSNRALVYNATDPWDASYNTTVSNFTVRLNCAELMKNQSVPYPHRIDPMMEDLWVNITHFEGFLNLTPMQPGGANYTDATLNRIEFYRDAPTPLPGAWDELRPEVYTLIVDGVERTLEPNVVMHSNVSLCIHLGGLPIEKDTQVLDIKYIWDDSYRYTSLPGFVLPNSTPSHTTIFNNESTRWVYDYNPANVTQPFLRDGVLEVMVW